MALDKKTKEIVLKSRLFWLEKRVKEYKTIKHSFFERRIKETQKEIDELSQFIINAGIA